MKKIIQILLIILSFHVYGREFSTDYPEVHLFNNASFTIRLEVLESVKYKYLIDDKATESESDTTFIIINNDYQTFISTLKSVLAKEKYNVLTSSVSVAERNKEYDRIYYFFQAAAILGPRIDFKPEAGNLCLTDNLQIDEILSSDYMINGMAKSKVRSLGYVSKRGLFREKIYSYQNRHYTKLELRKKIFNDTLEYYVSEPRNSFDKVILPSYNLFLEQNTSIIDTFRKKNLAYQEIITQLNLINTEYAKSKAETFKNREEYQVLARDFASEISLNGFNQPLPKMESANYDNEKDVFKTNLRNFSANIQRVVNDLNRQLASSLDTLKNLELNERIIELKAKKMAIDNLVSSPYDNLVQAAQKWIASNKGLSNLTNEQAEISRILSDRNNELTSARTQLQNFYKQQSDCLKYVQKKFLTITKLPFKVNNVDLEFNEGFIENILVVGDVVQEKIKYYNKSLQRRDTVIGMPSKSIKFENRYPIGFSRKRDFENLKAKHLFTMDGSLPKYKLHLEDLLRLYYQRHEVNRRDFSPADTVLRVSFDTKETTRYCHVLYKEATFKMFEAKVFSDFVGLDETTPNGLIQFEVEKKIPLITNRYPRKVFKYEMWNFGLLSYITPTLNLSKLEENNKDLSLLYRDEIVNGNYFPQRYASTLELKRHENFSVGWDLNLLLLDIPTFKSTFYLDYGFRYGRVSIVDSLRDYNSGSGQAIVNDKFRNYGVNTLQFFPRINWHVKSDERYSFNFSGSVNWYFLRSNAFNQVANEQVYADFKEFGNDRRVFANVSLLATLKPNVSVKGRLFFRYQYNWQFNYANTGFHQAQVGYSFYILANRNQ